MFKTCVQLLGFVAIASLSTAARADDAKQRAAQPGESLFTDSKGPILTLAQADKKEPMKDEAKPAAPAEQPASDKFHYREVSDFFNIREANPQVDKGEWEFEFETRWFTRSNGDDDEFGMGQTLKYGFTDDLFLELEVFEPTLGDGGNSGAGDINLLLFNRFVRETESMPAIAGFVEMRLPTGDGSEGVDASFNGIITKSFTDKCRLHVEGYVETANGGSGSEGDRKHFQWGVGFGTDYKLSEKSLLLANYINRTSEAEGGHNENVLEFGVVHEIARNGDVAQHIKFATDVGLDGASETPNLGAKFQWSIDWK